MRPAAAVLQARSAFGLKGANSRFGSYAAAATPLVEDAMDQNLSTCWRVTGILVDVHGVSPSAAVFPPTALLG